MTKNELVSKLENKLMMIDNCIKVNRNHIRKLEWFKNKIDACTSVHDVYVYEDWLKKVYGFKGNMAMAAYQQIEPVISNSIDTIYDSEIEKRYVSELLNCVKEIDEDDECMLNLFTLIMNDY